MFNVCLGVLLWFAGQQWIGSNFNLNSMHFFYFKAKMLQLQKIFLLVRFFNWISCNKTFKAKILCFFLYLYCLTPLRLECSRIRKTALFLTSYRLKKCKIPALTELHKWNEDVVNFKNLQFLKGGCEFLISYLSKMKTVSMF